MFTLLGISFIIFGILNLFSPFIKAVTKMSNSVNGVQTKITPMTILIGRIAGVIAILMGLYFIFGLEKMGNSTISPNNTINQVQHYSQPIK